MSSKYVPYNREKWLEDPSVREEYNKFKPLWDLKFNLKSKRIKKGLTQTEVAKRMKVHPSVVSRIESCGEMKSVSIETLSRYARAIGLKSFTVNVELD